MAKASIKYVQLRKKNGVRIISLEEMTKDFYLEHQQDIYCPNPECDANIEYCSGKRLTYFRSKKSIVDGEQVIEQHIEGCEYGIEHDSSHEPRTKYDSSIVVGLTEKHLKNSLLRAFKKHNDPEFGKPSKNTSDRANKKSKSKIKNNQTIIKGKISLTATTDEDEIKNRAPSLFQRDINDIGPRDFNEVRTVFGQIVEARKENNYFYLEIKMKNGKKGRIYFGEQYRVLNEVQYGQLGFYEDYLSIRKKSSEEIYGSFVGEIKKDEYDVSVYVSRYDSVCIDEKFHYDILRVVQSHR